MSKYAKILESKNQGRRQMWYICGSVPALVQDAYEFACAHVTTDGLDVSRYVLDGESATVADVLAFWEQEEYSDRVLLVMTQAHLFQDWGTLAPILRKGPSDRFFIAVSSSEPPNTKDTWASNFVNSTKTRFVVCDPMSPAELVTWVKSRVEADDDAVNLLIRKSWLDYGWLLSQMRKLELLNTPRLNAALIEVFCPGMGQPDFVLQTLRAGRNKTAAIAALRSGGDAKTDWYRLEQELRSSSMLNYELGGTRAHGAQLRNRVDVPTKKVKELMKRSAYYDLGTMRKCFSLLSRHQANIDRGSLTARYAVMAGW